MILRRGTVMINKKISVSQLSVIAFLSSVSFLSSMSSRIINGNFYDSIISALISCALGLLFSVPILCLHGRKQLTPLESSAASPFLMVLYFIFFIYSMAWNLTSISSMLVNTIFPDVAPWLLIVPMLLVAVYGCVKGAEAIGRSAFIIMVAFLLGIVLIIAGAMQLISPRGQRVFFYEGYTDLVKNTVTIFSRSTFLPQLVILISFASEGSKGSYVLWSGIAGIFTSGLLLVTQLCLGQYAGVLQYPVYGLAAASELAPLQRLDIIFSVIWLMIMLIRLTATLFAAGECVKRVLGPKAVPWGLVLAMAGTGATSWLVTRNMDVHDTVFSTNVYFIAAIILGAVIPSVVCGILKIQKKQQMKQMK